MDRFKKEGRKIMILEYNEIKEVVYDSYKSLHDKFHYTPQDTLYATIGEYDFSEEFSKVDEACIYINFAIIFYKNQEDFNFMKNKLIDIIKEENFNYYKENLKEEFKEFFNDLLKVKKILKNIS